MGARQDKIYHKRRAASRKKLERRKPVLEPRRRLLLVSEGSKTEPDYFKYLISKLNLQNIEVKVCGAECGSDPKSVVEFARDYSNREGSVEAGGYDEVYCLIDRDEHTTFDAAISYVFDLNKNAASFLGGNIETICSYPCFEVWILFHFTYSRAPIIRSGANSPGLMACKEVKKLSGFSEYSKKINKNLLETLFQNVDQAIENSKKASNDAQKTAEFNRSTDVHLLVEKIYSHCQS